MRSAVRVKARREFYTLICVVGALRMCAWNANAKAAVDGAAGRSLKDKKPGIRALQVDSLRRGMFRPDPLMEAIAEQERCVVRRRGDRILYAEPDRTGLAVWEMRVEGDALHITSKYSANARGPLPIRFDPAYTHATLPGIYREERSRFAGTTASPGLGFLRITARTGGGSRESAGYEAHRAGSLYPGDTAAGDGGSAHDRILPAGSCGVPGLDGSAERRCDL